MCHAHPTSGHLGTQKTRYRIVERCFGQVLQQMLTIWLVCMSFIAQSMYFRFKPAMFVNDKEDGQTKLRLST